MIRVEGLSKRYVLGRSGSSERYTALRDVLANMVMAPLRRWRAGVVQEAAGKEEAFWALRDVDLEVRRGEVVGIIGRNGAGKSTLLKLLSRITEPTSGRISLRGRVASLLEVGTGFHPELTGRENIYLNGAILGMSRVEIKAKFDEIVDFAEVEKFLDTPVKRYSSGMYVRLAFAVAAHLEPEILIVDEVLAVGDAEFQNKCLGKMRQVAHGQGRTVLFVSHNMRAVTQLCHRGIFLSAGRVVLDGTAVAATNAYLRAAKPVIDEGERRLTSEFVLTQLRISPNPVPSGAPAVFQASIRCDEDTVFSEFVFLLYTRAGMRIAILDCRDNTWPLRAIKSSSFNITARVRALPFVEGEYTLGVYLATTTEKRDHFDLVDFTVAPPQGEFSSSMYGLESLGCVHLAPEIACEICSE